VAGPDIGGDEVAVSPRVSRA